MPTLQYTVEADQDLREIVTYIARDNLSAALCWLDDTEALCSLLATQPAMGQRLQTRRFGEVRRHATGNYLIYFRPFGDGVEILRVVHGAREQEPLV